MSKLIGLMIARNEAWVLSASILAAMQWLDELVVFDHYSTDGTPDILVQQQRTHPNRIHVQKIGSPEWNEATYRQLLLIAGRNLGGTYFAIIDADEIVTKSLAELLRQRDYLNTIRPGELWKYPWIHCWRSLSKYRDDDSPFGRAVVPFIFHDTPSLSYAADPDGYQLHKRAPNGVKVVSVEGNIRKYMVEAGRGVLHLQHANWNRVVAKQTLYEMDEILRYGKVRGNYAATLAEDGLQLVDVPKGWWPVGTELVDMEAESWQQWEIGRLAQEYEPDIFDRSSLFRYWYRCYGPGYGMIDA